MDPDSSNDVLLACTIGDLTWLKQGLSSGIKSTAANKEGLNALHIAAKYGQLDCIKYLLDQCSIDVNCVALSTGSSALHYSIAHTNPTKSLQCTKLLLSRGGNHKCQNKLGETPLHVAAKHGHMKLVKLLLEKGAGIQMKDKEGQTPYTTACVHNQHECARLLRALHWANEKDSEDREKIRKEEVEKRQSNTMLALQQRIRKESADISYNQWLEKKSKQVNGPSLMRERKPVTYTRSTVSSRRASKSAGASAHKSNPQLTSLIKVNPKQMKRNVASVGKPEKMQPYTNYPPKSSGGRTSSHFLSKSRSEPPKSGRTSRSTLRSAASAPAGVKYYSKTHYRQTTIKREDQKQTAEGTVESKKAHESGYNVIENQEELLHEQLEEQELESRVGHFTNENIEEINKERITVAGDASKGDSNGQNLQESNINDSDKKVEGSSLCPHNQEEKEIDELDFSKLKENDIFNECTIEGDEDDLFHDVGQTNSLNALSLPNTLTKDRTPAEIIQLLRSFGGLSRSYNRSNSFSHSYSVVYRNRSQRRLSLGAIPEGQIVTSYSDEEQSSSQLLDEQLLESLIHSLSGDSGDTIKSKQRVRIQCDPGDGDQDSEPDSDDSETPSDITTSGSSGGESSADSDDICEQVGGDELKQKSVLPKVIISQGGTSPTVTRPQSLKVVNLAWDPTSNTVHSRISESPLSPQDFSKMGGRCTPTRRLTPPNNVMQSHKMYSPISSRAGTHSQSSMRSNIPSSPKYSPRDLSPCSSSSSSQPSTPRSLSPSDTCVIQPSTTGLKVEDLKTSSLMCIDEEPHHMFSSYSLHSTSMNSLSSKSMIISSASYNTTSTAGKTQGSAVESGAESIASGCQRVRSAPNIYFEQRKSQSLKTAVMEYGGTLTQS